MSSVASGETSSAAALGVAARTSATKSTIVTSVSWPIALTTGAREAATARASPSSLKHHRSSSDPPPRATMTTSTRSAMNARARRRLAGASGPWTRAGAITMCAIGYRRRKIVTMSCTTAPISEVTTPIFSGNDGSGRFRAASNRPSAASFLRVFWYAAQNAPTPAGVAALMSSWTDPRRGNTSTSPETTTSMPSSRSNPSISASSRMKVHADLGEEVGPALFSVHDAYAVLDDRAMLPQTIDGAAQGPSGRHDVLDEQHAFSAIQFALERMLCPVFLRDFAHHYVGLPSHKAHGRGDGDGAELDACDALREPGKRRHAFRDHAQKLRPLDCPLHVDILHVTLARRDG